MGFTLCTETNCIGVCWLLCTAEPGEQPFFILLACLVRTHAQMPAALCLSQKEKTHKAVQAAIWPGEVLAE